MVDSSATHVANYMLDSILKDLAFLKDNNFLPQQTYNEVLAILPTQITTTNDKRPPLPTRKSTNVALPMTASLPKLPVRRSVSTTPEKLVNRVLPIEENTTPPPAYSQKSPEPLATAEALYDYKGDPETDLSFKQGDIIEVIEYVNDDWWKGTVHGKSGIFPQNHVKKIPPSIKAKRPWIPPSSNKPPMTANTTTIATMPYSYPPPPTTIYAPPPPTQPPSQIYGQPSSTTVIVQQQQQEQSEGGDRVASMAKKFGGHVATAATWGFGATLGSQAANAIF
ncbi:SH3 domain-containing protein [Cokeromyces recurvatus]|uniref:SH3 domain-containing protein n=1 Tax=Cokeromyces recurvatus TaxID=90255 RepID=UPI00221FE180|nr:SH3 domain-containing protein [Cokeromyces recurvatus]KAI7897602.1 SH3 domain-containing protein [Cokeromyces recurvatus]